MSGERWRGERGAGDLSQYLQSGLPGLRGCRPQTGLRLRGEGRHQVHWDILPRPFGPKTFYHRSVLSAQEPRSLINWAHYSQLLSQPGDDVPRQQQSSQPQPRGLQTLAAARLPHPGEHHGGEYRPLPGGGRHPAQGTQDPVQWVWFEWHSLAVSQPQVFDHSEGSSKPR